MQEIHEKTLQCCERFFVNLAKLEKPVFELKQDAIMFSGNRLSEYI